MAICEAGPAFSTISPIRTISPSTTTVARSTGTVMVSSFGCANAVAGAARSRAVARRSERAVIVILLAEQRGRRLQHLVGSSDHLGVHFVGALRGDQIGHLRDDVDIGLFETALVDRSKAFGGGETILWRSG